MNEFWTALENEQELEIGQIRRALQEAQAALPYLRARGLSSSIDRVCEDIERLKSELRKSTDQKPRWIPFNYRVNSPV